VDVIVVQGGQTPRAALDATRSIPIVLMGPTADPVAEGFVESLARPGGNFTGVTGAPPEVELKRLQLLVEAVPSARTVAVLGTQPLDQSPLAWQSAAAYLGIALVDVRVDSPAAAGSGRWSAAIDAAVAQGADAVLVREGTSGPADRDLLVQLVERARLPTTTGAPDSKGPAWLESPDPPLSADRARRPGARARA
jgi:putative ABC transport system substrate-binding protein